MNIFIDCDETLVQTKKSLRDFYLDQFNPNVIILPGSYSYDWNVWDQNPDIAKKQHTDFIVQWTQSKYFTNILPLENAVPSVKDLKRHGHKLSVLTSISTVPATVNRRENSLRNIFGKKTFENIICLGLGQSKKQTLQERKADLFIDDTAEFVTQGIEVGVSSILINPIEQLPNGAYRAIDWNNIMEIIKTLNKSKFK